MSEQRNKQAGNAATHHSHHAKGSQRTSLKTIVQSQCCFIFFCLIDKDLLKRQSAATCLRGARCGCMWGVTAKGSNPNGPNIALICCLCAENGSLIKNIKQCVKAVLNIGKNYGFKFNPGRTDEKNSLSKG